jgi:hypothetical protein
VRGFATTGLLLCALLGGAAENAATKVRLLDSKGQEHRFALQGKVTAVIFLSAVCPVSNEYNERMNRLYEDYQASADVQILFVNSNATESGEAVRDHAVAAGFPFPVYRDIHNALADRLQASLTPEAVLLDRKGEVRYRGPMDNARNPARVKEQYLRDGMGALLDGKPVAQPMVKAFGCTIKREQRTL